MLVRDLEISKESFFIQKLLFFFPRNFRSSLDYDLHLTAHKFTSYLLRRRKETRSMFEEVAEAPKSVLRSARRLARRSRLSELERCRRKVQKEALSGRKDRGRWEARKRRARRRRRLELERRRREEEEELARRKREEEEEAKRKLKRADPFKLKIKVKLDDVLEKRRVVSEQ